jgi:hypothetical protein
MELPTANNARLQTMSGKTLKQFPHVNRLKKYVTPSRPIGLPEIEIDGNDNFDFDLEEIAEKKQIQKQIKLKKKSKEPEESQRMDTEDEDHLKTTRKETMKRTESQRSKEVTAKDKREEENEDIADILDIRAKGKEGIEYLVHWKDKMDAQDTWESHDYMSVAFTEKVWDFHKRKGLCCDRCGFLAASKNGIRNHRRYLCG